MTLQIHQTLTNQSQRTEAINAQNSQMPFTCSGIIPATLCVPVNAFYSCAEQTLSAATANGFLSSSVRHGVSLPETSHYYASYYRRYHLFSGTLSHRPMNLLIDSVSWVRNVHALSLWLKFFPRHFCFGLNEFEEVCLDWGQRRGQRETGHYCLLLKSELQKGFVSAADPEKNSACNYFWLLEIPLCFFPFH